MKVIFLDIDGVLNNCRSISQMPDHPYVGIDKARVRILQKIVESTDAKIVLTSTWKKYWVDYINNGYKNKVGKYMREKFRSCGLEIFDISGSAADAHSRWRGHEINDWLTQHVSDNIEGWVVLDDVFFYDYDLFDIRKHLIKTEFYGEPLTEEDVPEAIRILNNEF